MRSSMPLERLPLVFRPAIRIWQPVYQAESLLTVVLRLPPSSGKFSYKANTRLKKLTTQSET